MDPARWRDAVSVEAEDRLLGAIARLADFPVLDGTVARVIALADDPEATTADLVGALEADPTFAANLMRYSNSPVLARPVRAKTVRQAVMLVGRTTLRRLALEAATYEFFEKAPGTGSARGELHRHAVEVATVAAAAAEQVSAHGDGPHLGGLLHDIGRYVLPIAFGEGPCDEIAAAAPDGPERVALERERFGIDHALAGALVAERWGVSPQITAAIAWHHGGPTGVATPSAEIACVQLANELVRLPAGGTPDRVLLELALERAGLATGAVEALARQALGASLPDGALDSGDEPQTDERTGAASRARWLRAARAAVAEAATVAMVRVDGNAAELAAAAAVLAEHGTTGRLGGSVLAVLLPAGTSPAAIETRLAALPTHAGFAETGAGGGELCSVMETALADLERERSLT